MTELFMCTKCTKSYRLRHSLTRHLKFECGKEPKYACNICDKKFKHKYDLNVHEKGKHGLKIDRIEKILDDNQKQPNINKNNFPIVLGTKN